MSHIQAFLVGLMSLNIHKTKAYEVTVGMI
jgi:hypothetical protein